LYMEFLADIISAYENAMATLDEEEVHSIAMVEDSYGKIQDPDLHRRLIGDCLIGKRILPRSPKPTNMLTAGILVIDTTLVVINAPVAFCLSVVIIVFVIVSFICFFSAINLPASPIKHVAAPHEILQSLRHQIVARLLDSM